MTSFFQKARDRAQEAAAHIQQTVSNQSTLSNTHTGHDVQGSNAGGATGGGSVSKASTFTYTGSIPHALRHGIASVDPRYEYNRSFHQLSGRIKGLRIDHEALARESKGVAMATYRWGQDQLAERREDGAGDEIVADVTDRLAYVLSLIGDHHIEHAKNIESSRIDFKRIQKIESDLAPSRHQRVKIHKELMTLMPERAMSTSEKITALEDKLKELEAQDKAKEEELGKIKRDALVSSYNAHFDSMIALGEKIALTAKYGKLMLQQMPVYAPPFPTPRHHSRLPDEQVWQNEAQLSAIRAAVKPALDAHEIDTRTLPKVANTPFETASLSTKDTIKYAESNSQELAEIVREEIAQDAGAHSPQLSSSYGHHRLSLSSVNGPLLSPLPEGGSLPPHLNLEPTLLPAGRHRSGSMSSNAANHSHAPSLPPRSVHDEPVVMDASNDANTIGGSSTLEDSTHFATIAEGGPTFAETGSPIASKDPGPRTGVLTARKPSTSESYMPIPKPQPGMNGVESGVKVFINEPKEDKAKPEQQEVQDIAARIRRDGSIVRRGDSDWQAAEKEQLPAYQERE